MKEPKKIWIAHVATGYIVNPIEEKGFEGIRTHYIRYDEYEKLEQYIDLLVKEKEALMKTAEQMNATIEGLQNR